MTEITDDQLVNLPIQDGADDVEAHGMREVAVGLGVAAAVLGSGGTAHASQDAGTLETGTTKVTSTMHGTLDGTKLSTAKRLSGQLKDESETINSTARDGDTRVGSLESDVNKEVGTALAMLDDIKKAVTDLAEGVGEDVKMVKDTAFGLIDEKIEDVRGILGDLFGDAKTIADPVVVEANTQLTSTTDTLNAGTAFAVGEVNAAPGTINNELDAQMDTVKKTANDLELLKDDAASDAATLVGNAGPTLQGLADTAVSTATGAPKLVTDAAVAAVQKGQQTWDDTARGLTAPDVGQTISDGAEDIEKIASDPDVAAPVGGVDIPDVPTPAVEAPAVDAPALETPEVVAPALERPDLETPEVGTPSL